MPLINANEAALIQRNLVRSAIEVAKCEGGIEALQQLVHEFPQLRGLARAVRELQAHAQPMLFCDVVAA